ncbi:type VI secretion system tip protein VgrG, partial [Escherichia coli]|nr:type VI secretion system tip protein VgrG [Escherichia coli]
ILADDPSSHPKATYDKLEYLPSENLKESAHGYMTEWFAIENLKCPSVTLSGYNEGNLSEITITSESRITGVKASKGVYEDILPEGKREVIQKRSEAVMASCDSEIKSWYGKTNSWWLSCGERFSLDKQDYRITELHLNAVNNHIEDAGYFNCNLCASDNKGVIKFKSKFNSPVIPGVLLARVVGP